jgi:hypothetical protein
MFIDASQPTSTGLPPDWNLPKILDIRVQRIPFEPRKLRNFKSALTDFKEAVEFIVRTSGPIPARALGPALFIGDVPVIESEQMDENQYRFIAFDLARFKSGAPIYWGWMNTPKDQRKKTNFIYEEGQ